MDYLMGMLELLQHGLLFPTLVLLLVLPAVYLGLKIRAFRKDIYKLSDSLRVLIRTGRSPEGIKFKDVLVESIWRRIVSYYCGVLKERDSKNDISQILASGRGIVEASLEDGKVLDVLCEVIYKSASPEVIFVSAAIKGANGWELRSSVGISKRRLEDPFILASDKLPMEYRETIYTQASNGLEFDFRAIGVGLSLFVPLKTELGEVIGVVWIGFSEHSGAIPEGRKHTLELIAQHASASYVKARERNRSKRLDDKKKEEMLALSHDMKAPGTRALYAVRELDSLLEAKGLFDEKSLVQEVEYALVEQVNLFDKLFNVDVTVVDSGNSASSVEIDVGSILKSRVSAFRLVAKGVGLELNLSEVVRAKAKISRDLLERVLDNLISNSIKYTTSGSIEVVLLGSGSTLRIEVRDTGAGVEEELRKYLFSSRIRGAKQVCQQGHRYGLTVVKALVDEMGGSVGYSPNLPSGSIFFIELPATRLSLIIDSSMSNLQVLVVDDDALVRSTHERWLASLGVRAHGVATFKEALDHVSYRKPDFILTDLQLPGEEIERFLELLPEDLEVIVVSGRNRLAVLERLNGYRNVRAVLEKPISKGQLRELILTSEAGINRISRRRAA